MNIKGGIFMKKYLETLTEKIHNNHSKRIFQKEEDGEIFVRLKDINNLLGER